jgi:NAD(P)-dependent dehydrogenase (short-subunit alcohol dehydrogenase family)
MFHLEKKVIVVTGATGVLGGAFLDSLKVAGARLVLIGRNREVAEKRAAEINNEGGQAIAVIADVLDQSQLETGLEFILEKFGRIDGLINAAGGNIKEAVVEPSADIFSMNIDALKKVFDLNLYGSIIPTQLFGREMMKTGGGSIVNISSMASQKVITKVLGYSMAKAAVDMYTRWMSVELAHRFGAALRINAIAPGFFITHQNRSLLTQDDGSLTPRGKAVIHQTPYGRFGEPSELCGALKWLLSDSSSFVTGQVISIDGGFSVFSGV